MGELDRAYHVDFVVPAVARPGGRRRFWNGQIHTNGRRWSGYKAMAGECRRDVDFGRLDWVRRRDSGSPRTMALERLNPFDSPGRQTITQQKNGVVVKRAPTRDLVGRSGLEPETR